VPTGGTLNKYVFFHPFWRRLKKRHREVKLQLGIAWRDKNFEKTHRWAFRWAF
jgi:hypothetical protein